MLRYAPEEQNAGSDEFRKIDLVTSLLLYYIIKGCLGLSALGVYHTASGQHRVHPSEVSQSPHSGLQAGFPCLELWLSAFHFPDSLAALQ